jgi:hypothetical protein
MSLMNTRKQQAPAMPEVKMPRGTPNVPAPQPVERVYHEEVLSFLQQNADNKRMIVQVEAERDEWRRKALGADAECRRLEARIAMDANNHEQAIAKLTLDRDFRIEELTARRDDYKLALARFETKIAVQGKAVIDLANSISKTILETMDELKGERGTPDVAGAVGLAAIADAVERDNIPIPRVVTAGPASHNEEASS